MRLSCTINTVGCSSYLYALARNVDKPVETVILFEGAKVLQKCISSTPVRSKERIQTQVEFRNRTLWENGDPDNPKKRGRFVAGYDKAGAGWLFETSNWSGRGKRPRIISGRSFHPMEFFHWSDGRWSRWQSHDAAIRAKLHDVAQHVRSRGVAKATWYQIARQLGIEHLVSAPGYVRTAASRDGRIYQHGFGRQFRTPGQLFYIELENNSYLVVNRLDGASILKRAIDGRRAYFYRNVENKVFDAIATISRAYKGITVL